MTARRTLTLASAAALLSMPAWAVSSEASSSHGKGHGAPASAPGQTKDADEHGTSHGTSPTHVKSHKCRAHGVAFVVSGTLGAQELKETSVGDFGGPIELSAIERTNHHAKSIKAPFKETLTNVDVTFSNLPDTDADGTIALDDVAKGDEVKLIGKITTLAKKCNQAGFEPKITIRKVIFSAPASP